MTGYGDRCFTAVSLWWHLFTLYQGYGICISQTYNNADCKLVPAEKNMIRHHFELRETITTILADEQSHIDAAVEGIIRARQAVERCIAGDPFFGATFEPYTPESDEPVVLRMVSAAKKAGVGPMAAVAGAIAWSGIEAMKEAGAGMGVVDNGGDIALFSDQETPHRGSCRELPTE